MKRTNWLMLVLALITFGFSGCGDDDDSTPSTTDTETTVTTDTEITVNTDTEITVNTDTEITVNTDTEITVNTDTEITVTTDTEITVNTDTNAVAASVTVEYGSKTKDVALDGLATATLGSSDVVLIKTVVEAAALSITLADVTLDFMGSDGFQPSTKPTCSTVLPTDGANADKVGIDIAAGNKLVWDASLSMPKCAGVNDLGTILVVDK